MDFLTKISTELSNVNCLVVKNIKKEQDKQNENTISYYS